MQETQVQSLDHEGSLEKEMTTHSSILAWTIPWRAEQMNMKFCSLNINKHIGQLSIIESNFTRGLKIVVNLSFRCSLEGLMLKLKLQYFGHLMQRTNSFEKTLVLGKLKRGGVGDDRG